MPTIAQFEYVLAVDELKSFSRAAKKCHVSQPALSAQVQKVEEELELVIFDRSKKPILTTSRGFLLVAQIKKILREYRRIFDVRNDSGQIGGKFNLAVIPSLAPYLVPYFVKSFSNSFPHVQLSIIEMKTDQILDALRDDSVDAGLLVTPLKEDSLVERALFYEKFFVYASRQHQLTKKKFISDGDLDNLPVWLLEEGHCFRNQAVKICTLGRRNNVLPNISFASGSFETLVNLIRRGEGFTLLPELATISLSAEEKEENLRPFRKPVPTREVSLVHSRSFLKLEIIEELQKEILKTIPRDIRSLKRDGISVVPI